ncbi:ankrd29 [Symbiodinium sp. CCMP2592]|nr:ankrd29 [Symbiodinium sp. CCMP2592]
MSRARLAHAIVSQADSRSEEMRKHIESDFVDYFVELSMEYFKLGCRSIVVLTEAGFEVKTQRELIHFLEQQGIGGLPMINERSGCIGRFHSSSHMLNCMSLLGYEVAFSIGKTIRMKRRVPRAFLQAHPTALI